MNEKEILKKLFNNELTISDVMTDVKLVVIPKDVPDQKINKAKISRSLYQQIKRSCKNNDLPFITCHYDNGILKPGIKRRFFNG